MHGSRSKIPSKNLVRRSCADGPNSGVKGLIVIEKKINFNVNMLWTNTVINLIKYYRLKYYYADNIKT
jgi:hypothetical protein